MKIQDALFLIILVVLFYRRKSRDFSISGLICLALAIPLFYFWVFFTAQRLTWYAAAFFLSALFLQARENLLTTGDKVKKTPS